MVLICSFPGFSCPTPSPCPDGPLHPGKIPSHHRPPFPIRPHSWPLPPDPGSWMQLGRHPPGCLLLLLTLPSRPYLLREPLRTSLSPSSLFPTTMANRHIRASFLILISLSGTPPPTGVRLSCLAPGGGARLPPLSPPEHLGSTLNVVWVSFGRAASHPKLYQHRCVTSRCPWVWSPGVARTLSPRLADSVLTDRASRSSVPRGVHLPTEPYRPATGPTQEGGHGTKHKTRGLGPESSRCSPPTLVPVSALPQLDDPRASPH